MRHATYTLVTLLVTALIIASCASTNLRTYSDDFKDLNNVNSSDGINQEEAYIVAKAFFWSNISGCGFPDKPVKEANHWVSQTRIGYARVLGEPIYIDENNGNITWGSKNNSATLEELKSISNTSFQPTPKSGATEL